ncbi:FAD binding domain-containing protein [Alkalilacustris brevis]|uniref:FAD binding domain-containing protein n=1 Tax=Alkalilacustris brevis TaxID=2026338 RepID=UPI000E0DAE88|nr:FAD binding domain-containing protein [Alkalilacustris brevis]
MFTYDSYHMPLTLRDALEAVAKLPSGGRVIAGGTDIVPWAREGRAGDVHFPVLVDVSRVDEFQGYDLQGGRVRLNANVVYQDFLDDAVLRANLPCMPHCAIWFADDQIRQQATLAGNLVNASPAADGTPPMLTLNAEVELVRLDSGEIARRTVPLTDFVLGPGKTVLAEDELISAVICDALPGYGGSFQKVGQRRSLVISRVCAAALVKTSADGRVFEDVRLALGGVGPVPARLTDIEDMLRGQPVSAGLIAEASVKPAERVASRSRVEYRRHVVQGFVQAAIEDALAAAGAPRPGQKDREKAHA